MKKIISVFLALALVPSLGVAAEKKATVETEQAPVAEENVSDGASKKSNAQIGLELLGAGLIYSVSASFKLQDQIAINGGFTYYSVSGSSTTSSASGRASLMGLPLSLSYLLGGPDHYFDLSAGAIPFFASAELRENDTITERATGSLFVPQLGISYRYWPVDGGFHFRATLYGLIVSSKLYPWVGFQFGYAF